MKNKAWRNALLEPHSKNELTHYLIEAWTRVDELEDFLGLKDREPPKKQ